MTLPAAFLAATIDAARSMRDFDARPLSVEEQREITTLWLVGHTAEQIAGWLGGVPIRPQAPVKAVGR